MPLVFPHIVAESKAHCNSLAPLNAGVSFLVERHLADPSGLSVLILTVGTFVGRGDQGQLEP
jgi:hypothetical protein